MEIIEKVRTVKSNMVTRAERKLLEKLHKLSAWVNTVYERKLHTRYFLEKELEVCHDIPMRQMPNYMTGPQLVRFWGKCRFNVHHSKVLQ